MTKFHLIRYRTDRNDFNHVHWFKTSWKLSTPMHRQKVTNVPKFFNLNIIKLLLNSICDLTFWPPKISFIESKCCWLRSKKEKSMPKSKWKFRDFFRYCNVEGKKDNFQPFKTLHFQLKEEVTLFAVDDKKLLYFICKFMKSWIYFRRHWEKKKKYRGRKFVLEESTRSFISLCAKINSFVKMSWNRKLIQNIEERDGKLFAMRR